MSWRARRKEEERARADAQTVRRVCSLCGEVFDGTLGSTRRPFVDHMAAEHPDVSLEPVRRRPGRVGTT